MHRQLVARDFGTQCEVQDGLRQQALLDVVGDDDAVPERVKRLMGKRADGGNAARKVFRPHQLLCVGVGVQVCPVLVRTPLFRWTEFFQQAGKGWWKAGSGVQAAPGAVTRFQRTRPSFLIPAAP